MDTPSAAHPPQKHDYGESVDGRENAALVALFRHRKGGWGALVDEIEERGSALSVLSGVESQPTLLAGHDGSDQTERALAESSESIEMWAEAGIGLVTILDDLYPPQLRTIHQRPPFLFYRGALAATDADGVAVVGTRKPTERGLRQASAVATDLVERGVTVISGLAAGIDTASHEAAIRAGGRTVGVIGTGINRCYPRENGRLQDYLAREHLVLSQFWPDAEPTRTSFPMRNAVMSGYAAATVVIEAGQHSGARIQARLALEHGRPVLLMNTLLEHDWARDFASRPGAYVVRSSAEVHDRLDDILAPSGPLILA